MSSINSKRGIDESIIRRWKKKEQDLAIQGNRDVTRVGTTGRPVISDDMETELSAFIQEKRERRLRVTRKELMVKARSYNIPNFKASHGWLDRFLARNGFTLRRKTTDAQKEAPQMTRKLVSFVKYVRRLRKELELSESDIFAMDETAVWLDCPGNKYYNR